MEELSPIEVRPAREEDAPAVREIFIATYGEDYPDADFYDEQALKKLIYSEDTIMMAAVDRETGSVLGTGSVMLEFGAYSDLVGEFGRLAVHPDARSRGVAGRIMEERIRRVEERLHLGLIEARTCHDFSQKNAERYGFAPVGFLPGKLEFAERESASLLTRYFGHALDLRKNNPRIIPEVHPVAARSLANLSLPVDPVLDDRTQPYPPAGNYQRDDFTTRGYAALLRMERGRLERREIFGPMRLHYGFFKISAARSTYLVARDRERIVGALGYTEDPVEHTIKVFELIHLRDDVVRFLLEALVASTRNKDGAAYVEVDVHADAPSMQRTLLELGFVPCAYVPAMTFYDVERVDVVRMVRVDFEPEEERPRLTPSGREFRALFLEAFAERRVLPELGRAVRRAALFRGLNDEQANRIAGFCARLRFAAGETIVSQGRAASEMFVVLAGGAEIEMGKPPKTIASVSKGDTVGEMALLLGERKHSATVLASTPVEALRITRDDLEALIRRRPDIGVALLRNLAREISAKLRGSDLALLRSR